jgi:epoxide hydrolase-like predicted phosphatase
MMAKERPNIEAVIWDLGGVILRTEDQGPRQHWEARLGLAPGELHRLVFEGELGKAAALGLADTSDIWTSIGEMFSLPADQLQEMEQDFWSCDRIDEDLVRYIRDLHPEFRTALLSNAWPSVRDTLQNRWEIADIFDAITLSCEVGLAKPDPRIYQISLEALGLPAEQALFIDDFERNIEGARRVGMAAIRFQTAEQTRREIDDLLRRTE